MESTNERNFKDVFKNSIKITPRTISIKTLLSERNLRRINYKPYYQRNYVWDNVKQSFFIESVILGTEIPPLILFKSGTQIEVIDGRQRFETLKKFKENDIVLTEKGLLTLPALAKQSFNKLKNELKDIFWNSNIRVFEFEVIVGISPILEDKIKKEIFRRYNTGITPLTSVEVDAAKHDNDELSNLFEADLKDETYLENNRKCFFPNEIKSPDLGEKIIDFHRRAFILSQFPISIFATGNQRNEIISILYETKVNSIEDLEFEHSIFKQQVETVFGIYDYFLGFDKISNNKFIYEAILWAVRILDQELIYIDYKKYYSVLLDHYSANQWKYSDGNSFFYKTIIERYSDTAEIFEKISKFKFEIFIRRNDFRGELKNLKQSVGDAEGIIKILDSLRINKPSPISKPIEEILSDVITQNYLIRPSYQRQEKISVLKASSIIESILLGIYLPPIFIFKRKNGVVEVIDGQQRLLSVIAFLGKNYRNELGELSYSINNSYKLKGLNILSKLNGHNYSSLLDVDKDKILDFIIDEIIIDESLNEGFEPTDLFIRLNQKPYPINNNSFEMWNSTVNSEIINKIKEVTNKYISWFYSKESSDNSNRTDRMENEELITILSFVINHINKDKTYFKVLGLFRRTDRITCRLQNKSAITDFLIKLDDNNIERENFILSIEKTEELILMFAKLFDGRPTKEDINMFFNIKKTKTFRRSYQDFYITWLILNSVTALDTDEEKQEVISNIQNMLVLLKNANKMIVDETYFNNFIKDLDSLVLKN